MKNDDPFLFEDMTEPITPSPMPATAYMDPAESLAFSIMEDLDLLLKKEVTIEQYDAAQKRVKKLILEALGEKSPGTLGPNGLPLLIVRPTDFSI